jgi:hypothetical protein
MQLWPLAARLPCLAIVAESPIPNPYYLIPIP